MWNDERIRQYLAEDPPIAYTPDPLEARYGPILDEQVQPASLDVRLGEEFIAHPSGERIGLDEFFSFTLLPGECLLASLIERLHLPSDVVARIEGKSSLARRFLTIHSAGFIDPGFHGDVTLEVKNDGRKPIQLKPGMLIGQISFQWLEAAAARPYGDPGINSHYQGQEGATPAWSSETRSGDGT